MNCRIKRARSELCAVHPLLKQAPVVWPFALCLAVSLCRASAVASTANPTSPDSVKCSIAFDRSLTEIGGISSLPHPNEMASSSLLQPESQSDLQRRLFLLQNETPQQKVLTEIRLAYRSSIEELGFAPAGAEHDKTLLPPGVEVLLQSLPRILLSHPRHSDPKVWWATDEWNDPHHIQFVIRSATVALMVYSNQSKEGTSPEQQVTLDSLLGTLSKAHFEYLRLKRASK